MRSHRVRHDWSNLAAAAAARHFSSYMSHRYLKHNMSKTVSIIRSICEVFVSQWLRACCCVLCLVTQSCLVLCDLMDCNPPGGFVHGNSPGRNTGGLACPPLGDLPNPGTEPRSSALRMDSLPSELPGKPKNTAVHSLSLLQGIFLTRNWTRVSWIAGGFFTSWATREAWLRAQFKLNDWVLYLSLTAHLGQLACIFSLCVSFRIWDNNRAYFMWLLSLKWEKTLKNAWHVVNVQ